MYEVIYPVTCPLHSVPSGLRGLGSGTGGRFSELHNPMPGGELKAWSHLRAPTGVSMKLSLTALKDQWAGCGTSVFSLGPGNTAGFDPSSLPWDVCLIQCAWRPSLHSLLLPISRRARLNRYENQPSASSGRLSLDGGGKERDRSRTGPCGPEILCCWAGSGFFYKHSGEVRQHAHLPPPEDGIFKDKSMHRGVSLSQSHSWEPGSH